MCFEVGDYGDNGKSKVWQESLRCGQYIFHEGLNVANDFVPRALSESGEDPCFFAVSFTVSFGCGHLGM